MTFENFTEKIKNILLNKGHTDLSTQTIKRNNGYEYVGLVIRNNSTTLSVMNLSKEYDSYQKGVSPEAIVESFLKKLTMQSSENILDTIYDFNKIKDKIVIKLCNKSKNKDKCRCVPHKDISDFTITYNVKFDNNMSTIVTNHLLGYWDISPEDLHDIAIENTSRLAPIKLDKVSDMLDIPTQGPDKYVLYNSSSVFGATCLAYPEILELIEEELGEFYIIPSSVHEIIIVKQSDYDTSLLKEMLTAINAENNDYEWLSDDIYKYDYENKSIVRAYSLTP